MIEVESLTKVYVDAPVVDDIAFFVPEGQVLGFLGPNGAGKTTAMRMITAFLPPTAGRVVVAGIDLDHDRLAAGRSRSGAGTSRDPTHRSQPAARPADDLRFHDQGQ